MCRLLSAMIIAFGPVPLVSAQTSPAEKRLFDELDKAGIVVFDLHIDVKASPRIAQVNLRNPGAVKGMNRLRDVKNLSSVSIFDATSVIIESGTKIEPNPEIKSKPIAPQHIEEALQRVAELPHVTTLRLHIDNLSADHLKRVASMKQLETLGIEVFDITDQRIRDFHALKVLKNLKELQLARFKVSPNALADLKAAFVHVEFARFLKPFPEFRELEIAAKEAPLIKLQKAKYNAAIAEVKRKRLQIEAGKRPPGDVDFLQSLGRVKDAAADLGDLQLSKRTLEDYLDIAEMAYAEARARVEAGSLDPDQFHRAHYFYLDAQIELMRFQKKLESK